MYIIGLADGSNTGLFDNEDEALQAFVAHLAEHGEEPLRSTALGLKLTHDDLIAVFEQRPKTEQPGALRRQQDEDRPSVWTKMARNLLKDAECFIWIPAWVSGVQVYPTNSDSPTELGQAILGEMANSLISPFLYLHPVQPVVVFSEDVARGAEIALQGEDQA